MKVYAKIKTSQLIVKKMPYSDIVQKMILITEKILPLGSVVEVDIRELKLETEKPVSSIKAVIVDRFMKKETEKQYVPYCGIIYPFGDSKKQLFFTEQAIHTVIHLSLIHI